jgi:hypothetical protein
MMNPCGGIVHRGQEKQKSVRFMASRRGRCAPEAKVGWCAPILCGGQGEGAVDVSDELMLGDYGRGKRNRVRFD